MSLESRKFMYVHSTVHDTTGVVNYDSENQALNKFISVFDVWGGMGYFKCCTDIRYTKVEFECLKELHELVQIEEFKRFIKNRYGVDILFDNDERVLELD